MASSEHQRHRRLTERRDHFCNRNILPTSPPRVFNRISRPSISQLSSISASMGSKCSYLVAFVLPLTASCPSISPMIVINLILWCARLSSRSSEPVSLISAFFSLLLHFSAYKNTSIPFSMEVLYSSYSCIQDSYTCSSACSTSAIIYINISISIPTLKRIKSGCTPASISS